MNYASSRDMLVNLGYKPIPIVKGEKRPAVDNWASPDCTPPACAYGNGHGVGLLCGAGAAPLAAVDIDVFDTSVVAHMSEYVTRTCGETLHRVGRSPKTMLIYRYDRAGIVKITSRRYTIGRVEILGAGQQFVAFGTHPDTMRPYDWPGMLGSALDVPAAALPQITETQARAIIAEYERYAESCGHTVVAGSSALTTTAPRTYDPTDPLDAREPIAIEWEVLSAKVRALDPDMERDTWLRVGMALHHQSHGEVDGLALWDEWSAKGAKYKPNECEKFWEGFGRSTRQPVTAAYILKIAKAPAPKPVTLPTSAFADLPWEIGRFVRRPAPVEMIIDDMLPRKITAMLYSAGGAGKSTFFLYMAIKIALGNRWDTDIFGHAVNGGKVVMLSGEDDDHILNLRIAALIEDAAEALDISYEECFSEVRKHFYVVSTVGKVVQFFTLDRNGVLHTTEQYDQLVKRLQTLDNVSLVVVDTKSRFSPGEGAGNVVATQEIAYYEALAQTVNASVMLLHHTSKAHRGADANGAQAYRDATALFDTVRAAWMLTGLEDPEALAEQGITPEPGATYLVYECTKQSYGQRHNKMIVKRQGFTFTAQSAKPKSTPTQRKEEQRKTELLTFITLMRGVKGAVCQSAVYEMCAAEMRIGRRKAEQIVELAIGEGLLAEKQKDKRYEYVLTDAGKMYQLTVGGA